MAFWNSAKSQRLPCASVVPERFRPFPKRCAHRPDRGLSLVYRSRASPNKAGPATRDRHPAGTARPTPVGRDLGLVSERCKVFRPARKLVRHDTDHLSIWPEVHVRSRNWGTATMPQSQKDFTERKEYISLLNFLAHRLGIKPPAFRRAPIINFGLGVDQIVMEVRTAFPRSETRKVCTTPRSARVVRILKLFEIFFSPSEGGSGKSTGISPLTTLSYATASRRSSWTPRSLLSKC